ncbi:MAG TPA: glycosyltransferase [Chitinophagaceae bacterium]|jgi:glycosyltransferase involved in cell wall biosynthesis|nr:glycosyltransferase [Chitinophagaceae bacterium]
MNEFPTISICIPAYKNIKFLKRLFDSIAIQDFRDFEVIVTDDSPGKDVELLCNTYEASFSLIYYKNYPALGSPANWNKGISYAKGEWIKIMHDDDWFVSSRSLGIFASATKISDIRFIFSGFNNVSEDNKFEVNTITAYEKYLLRKNPVNLLKRNFIGHPSTTLIRKDIVGKYDEKLKWVVDLEYYIRVLGTSGNFFLIDGSLINIGISKEQITSLVFRKPDIEIPENIYLLKRIGTKALKNIFAYDYFWRFIRNLKVRDIGILRTYYNIGDEPDLLLVMVKQQKLLPFFLLNIGAFSKVAMLFSYLRNRIKKRMQ